MDNAIITYVNDDEKWKSSLQMTIVRQNDNK